MRDFVLFALLFGALAGSSQAQSFTPTGLLPGDKEQGVASNVSGDGSVVVGSTHSPLKATVWTSAEGLKQLPYLNDYLTSGALGVSGDGKTIVGMSGLEPVRWTADGVQSMGALPNVKDGFATDVSFDGAVAVGVSGSGISDDGEAFRWSESGGIKGLGTLPNFEFSIANGVSGDGSHVVGASLDTESQKQEAFRWTQAGGMVGLGMLSGDLSSYAWDISDDGRVIVGKSGDRAFRWTAAGGMTDLGGLPGADDLRYEAKGVSADGSIIVGDFFGGFGPAGAFYWSEGTGMLDLKQLLIANGVADANGWNLEGANGVSSDGRSIVGTASNLGLVRREGYIATVPEPAGLVLALLGAVGLIVRRVSRRPLQSTWPKHQQGQQADD